MPQDRFYLNTSFSIGSIVQLADDEMKHLFVMRPKIQTQVDLVNGKGDLAKASITAISKKEITLMIDSLHHEEAEPFKFIIAQGIPKGSRLDTILEKGTELGMTELWLFPAERSEKTSLNPARIEKILVAAMKQCGRLYLPKILTPPPIEKWNELPFTTYFGAFQENAPHLLSAWQKSPPQNGAIFVIGPESGLTKKEEAQLINLKAEGVSLHKNILRTDTAPLAALTLMTCFKNNL